MNTTVPVAVPSTNHHDIPVPVPATHAVPPTSSDAGNNGGEMMTDTELEKLDPNTVIGGIISVGEVRQLGKEFRMTTECFLPRTNDGSFWRQAPPTASELTSEPPKRVTPGATARENKHAQNLSIWRRLYTFLPERLHPLLRHSVFIGVFEYAGRCIRKHWTLTLRRALLPLVFEHIPLSVFTNTPLRVGNEAVKQLLFWPDLPTTHSLFPPFVYVDGLCDNRKLLLSELLMKVLRGLIKGQSSISPVADGPKIGRPKTSAEMWGLTKVDPGLLVLIITLVRFILSSDPEFARVGAVSGAPYADFYHETMDFLIIGRNTPTVKRIFATWNEIVFGRAPTVEPTSSDQRERPAGTEVADLLRELALENGTVGSSSSMPTAELAPPPVITIPSIPPPPRPSTISLTQASQITTTTSMGPPIVSFSHNVTATIILEAENEPEGGAPPVPAVPRARQKRKATPAARTCSTRSTAKNGP
ncbi:hypothetical protein BDN72DRAFT_938422 [Pluteus cervinus]|uniref:Uncharacterized protein n=1 Tax=Pluteus cervinus TaxID=181527 RepID=A0ACD3A3Z0_9AGAR|nr:hypothetical protein BDN72DRAFT_938422 [Pluteus cervinus]